MTTPNQPQTPITDEQVEQVEQEAHPEDFCKKCRKENPVWFAPNELWNKYHGEFSILCPNCFTFLAGKEQTIVVTREDITEKELSTLRAELEYARNLPTLANWASKADSYKQQITKLHTALEKYGRHNEHCAFILLMNGRCTCGLKKALV